MSEQLEAYPVIHLRRDLLAESQEAAYRVTDAGEPVKIHHYTKEGITYYPGEAPDTTLGNGGLAVLGLLVAGVIAMHYVEERSKRKGRDS